MYIYLYILIVLLLIIIVIYSKKCKYDKSIMILYRQAARWAAASIQDDSELIRLLHANYAAGYLWSIKDIASSEDFNRITGEDLLTFENEIVNIQDIASKKIVSKCPSLVFTSSPQILKAMYSRQPI